MKTFSANSNDGTLVISNQIKEPAQGTWISDELPLIVAKGIVRPCLYNPHTKESEAEAHCIEAAFGRKLSGKGKFYKLGVVGEQNNSLALQTVLFSAKNPEKLIAEDAKRFKTKTAIDTLGRDTKLKVEAGVPPALLLNEMAPWDEFRKFEVPGIRATVYGSTLVPKEHNNQHPCFMLLKGSALRLAKQLDVEPHELLNRWFLVHRDPALPDGSSLYPAMFVGVLEWANEAKASHGVILNPEDPFWKSCGGDFDGDAACVYVPSSNLLPRGAVSRPDYLLNGKKYSSEEVKQQMLEAAAETTTSILGPIILSAMRIVERNLDTNLRRGIMAGVAQGSVQAKKHPVASDSIQAQYGSINYLVTQHRNERPFIVDYINGMTVSVGFDDKMKAWNDLVAAVEQGTWDEGEPIELAFVERVRTLNSFIQEVDWFRMQKQTKLPQPMVDAAKTLCSKEAASYIKELSAEYRKATIEMYQVGEDNEYLETDKAIYLDKLSAIRETFKLTCLTGKMNENFTSVEDIHLAMVAHGPAKLAARMVSPSVFQKVSASTQFMLLSLEGHDWSNKVYSYEELKPISDMRYNFDLFTKSKGSYKVELIHKAPRSTRVKITAK